MISKLKRRYFISNMALLSITFLIALGILFGILYHSEVKSSYTVMNTLLEEASFPESDAETPDIAPTAYDQGWVGEPQPTWGYPPPIWWQTETFASDTSFTTTTTTTTTTTSATTQSFLSETAPMWGNPFWWQYHPWPYYYVPPYWQFPPEENGGEQSQPATPPNTESTAPNGNGQQPSDDKKKPGNEKDKVEPPNGGPVHTTTTTAATSLTQSSPLQSQPIPADGSKPTPPGEVKPDSGHEKPNHTTPTQPQQVPATPSATTAASAETAPQQITVSEAQKPQDTFEEKSIPDVFVAQFDQQGNIESYSHRDDNAELPDTLDTVNNAMDKIQKQGDRAGTLELNNVSYRFLYEPDPNGTYRLVLLNRTLELSTISRLVVFFLFLMLIGLVAISAISELLANWTVKPIAAAWEKQKQFVADASHELKTPLAVISANTEVILSNPSASVMGQSKWIHYIQSETTRMSKLITNLLSIARMDHQNDTETLSQLHLSDLVSNICLVFEPIIYENGKTLNTVIQRNVSIKADEDNVRQLLSILLDNAVLHSVKNAQITVTLSKDVQGKIRIAVANTANDIPKDELVHLFDRFYRADVVGSPNGSGLGLSIAKSIVQQMGGTISVTSENHLVTFVATFPA